MRRIFLSFTIIVFLIGVDFANAQMFSVPDRQERLSRPTTIIRLGTTLTAFDYTGSLDPTTGPSLLERDNAMLAFSFETLGLSAYAILGNSITGIDDGSFFDLNLKFTNGIPVVRRLKFQAGIPIQLSTGITASNSDFTGATNQNINTFSENRFNQTHFGGGTGAFVNFNPSRKIQFQNTATVGYAFSNSNGGFFGGTMVFTTVSSRFNILNLIGSRTLSIGYDFIFRSYDIDSESYDYDLSGHQLTIGLSL